MKPKSMQIMAILAAAMSSSGYMDKELYQSNKASNKAVLKKKKITKPIPKGMKEFYYEEVLIYALNQKNADRKAKKLGLIK